MRPSLRFAFINCIVLLMFTSSVHALENAYRWRSQANQAAYSAIVTGNPTIRDAPGTDWSYMRVAVQRIINSNVYYAEIGWLKGTYPESNLTPRSYWTYRATDGTTAQGWGGYPSVGVGYNYRVSKSGTSNYWDFYFNSLTTPLVTRWVGWNTADRFFSGGEVPTSTPRQGMGDSHNNNVQYLSTTGSWYAACNMTEYISDTIYHITDGANCSSWRIYGNN